MRKYDVAIEAISPEIVRIRAAKSGSFEPDHSYAVVKSDWPESHWDATWDNNFVIFSSSGMHFHFSRAGFGMKVSGAGDTPYLTSGENKIGFRGDSPEMDFSTLRTMKCTWVSARKPEGLTRGAIAGQCGTPICPTCPGATRFTRASRLLSASAAVDVMVCFLTTLTKAFSILGRKTHWNGVTAPTPEKSTHTLLPAIHKGCHKEIL